MQAYILIKSKGELQYRKKRHKLDAKAYINFFVKYKTTNIYRIWVQHKKKVVSVRDIIFNKDKVWDGMPFQHTTNKIKKLNKAIQVIKLLQIDKLEDIQLSEDLKVESEITFQTDNEAKDLDANNIAAKTYIYKLAKDEDQK